MFKRDIFNKLNILKEEKVESFIHLYNPFSITCKNGIIIVSPFGSHSYSFEIVFDNKENFINFVDIIDDSRFIRDDLISGHYVFEDNTNKFFKISGFINSALIEELTLFIKEKLNG